MDHVFRVDVQDFSSLNTHIFSLHCVATTIEGASRNALAIARKKSDFVRVVEVSLVCTLS